MSLPKVDSLKNFRTEMPNEIKRMEKIFETTQAADLQVPYDEFCQKATLIEDDLKEALRRKPKKAKTAADKQAPKAKES